MNKSTIRLILCCGAVDGDNFWEKSGGVYQSTLGLVKHK